MDVFNKYLVGSAGEDIVIMRPATRIPKKDALVFAAWIVALSETESGEFEKVLREVENT